MIIIEQDQSKQYRMKVKNLSKTMSGKTFVGFSLMGYLAFQDGV